MVGVRDGANVVGAGLTGAADGLSLALSDGDAVGLEVTGERVGKDDGLLECVTDAVELPVSVGDDVGFLDGSGVTGEAEGLFVG